VSTQEIVIENVSHDFERREVRKRGYLGLGVSNHSVERIPVLRHVSLCVGERELVAMVGPSGCGKTTLLRMCAGLLRPTNGSVLIGGQQVAGPMEHVGYMAARDGLMPWRSVVANVELGLELRGVNKATRRAAALRWLGRVGLEKFAFSHPWALSQGMRQRVALARTLVTEPRIVLMDEPFAALDAQTRTALQSEFLQVWHDAGAAVVLVTHDVSEALVMGERVVVFSASPGRIIDSVEVPWSGEVSGEAIRLEPQFSGLWERIWEDLRQPEKSEEM
jgi:NitT/TauT family transport system ATP-binding protein